jgi:hypothetical protein
LLVSWAAGTNVDHYHIYVKAGTATGLFDHENFTAFAHEDLTALKIKVKRNGVEYLDGNTTYYVGVRAASGIETEDSNTASLSEIPSDNINAAVAAIPAGVWANGTRTLTSGGGGGGATPAEIWDEPRAARLLALCERVRLVPLTFDANGQMETGTIKTYATNADYINDVPLATYAVEQDFSGLTLNEFGVNKQ